MKQLLFFGKIKAEELNKYFSSVFTIEEMIIHNRPSSADTHGQFSSEVSIPIEGVKTAV